MREAGGSIPLGSSFSQLVVVQLIGSLLSRVSDSVGIETYPIIVVYEDKLCYRDI